MKRAIAIALGLVVIAAVVAARPSARAADSGAYRITATFDTAKGLLPGGRVKVAGATVGSVKDVSLDEHDNAVVTMSIDPEQSPFRQDATCAIRISGLIGESFVDCNPGIGQRAPGRPLRLPLARTSVPVDLSDFYNIWSVPVRDRLRILLNELGAGLSGRGDDLNALLRRANPALRKANAALAEIDRQRADLAELVRATDAAIAPTARHPRRLRAFIREAGATMGDLATARAQLREGFKGFPPTLRLARTGAQRLSAFARDTTPLLGDLQHAAPALTSLQAGIPSFSADGIRALGRLAPALRQTRRALGAARPFTNGLRSFSAQAVPLSSLLSSLLVSLRDRGAIEYALKSFYAATAYTARFDEVSHLAPSLTLEAGCDLMSTKPQRSCEAHYAPQDDGSGRNRRRRARRLQPASAAPSRPLPNVPAPLVVPDSPGPKLPRLPGVPNPATAGDQATRAIEDLLDYLLAP